MTMERRTLSKIILLNCITLGIYGAVTYQRIGHEMDALFDGDGEQPRFGFIGAVLIGLICPIYRWYWWYRQASRMKLNAGRFGLVVRESGVDMLLFRSIGEILLIPATAVSLLLHLLLPALVCWVMTYISYGLAVGVAILAGVVLLLFLPDCTAGAYMSIYFMIKNMNRIADTGANGSAFDPMGYEYYPSVQNHYVNFVPQLVYDDIHVELKGGNPVPETAPKTACLEATRGSNKGYTFELTPGEELVIGRNPSEANVVIDNMYEKVSGRHVGIMYEPEFDTFRVVDYSLNGTYVDGQKLINGKEYSFRRGARIELVDGKNAFRLK